MMMNLDFFDNVADTFILERTRDEIVNEPLDYTHLIVVKVFIILYVFEDVLNAWIVRIKLLEIKPQHSMGVPCSTCLELNSILIMASFHWCIFPKNNVLDEIVDTLVKYFCDGVDIFSDKFV